MGMMSAQISSTSESGVSGVIKPTREGSLSAILTSVPGRLARISTKRDLKPFNSRSFILTAQALLGCYTEFEVLGRYEYLVGRKEQFNKVCGLVGADAYPAYGVHQFQTVGYDVVGIVLRDDAAVSRIVAVHQTANHMERTKRKESICFVERYVYVVFCFTNKFLRMLAGFFWQDERSIFRSFDI